MNKLVKNNFYKYIKMNIDLESEALHQLLIKIKRYILGTTYYTGKGIFHHPNNYDGHKMNFETKIKDKVYNIIGYRQEEKIPLEDGSHKIKATFIIEYDDRPTKIEKEESFKTFEHFFKFDKEPNNDDDTLY